jgi:hypothetical protein
MRGPAPSVNSTCAPAASSGIRMSLKMMTASDPTMRTGWSETSAAASGVLHIVRKS